MKPEEREDRRYTDQEFCEISREEEIMFELLKKHGRSATSAEPLRILDLGCGSGRITAELVKLGHSVRGIDFSEEAVKRAAEKGLDVKQANLDEGIPEENASYDAVWAGDVVEHVFDPIGLLTESHRVLRPGGIMLITIPSDVGIISRIKMLFGISHQEQMYYTSGFYKHHTFFTPRLIKFMLKKAGFRIAEFQKILIFGKTRFHIRVLPAAFFNEMIFAVRK